MISNTIHGPPVSADLLNASLRHVPDLGWSEETLNAGARDLNISSQEVSLLVPEGPIGLVHHFVRKSNQDLSSHPLLAERLHSHKKDNESNTGNEGNKSNESNESKGGQTTDDQPIQSAAERLSIVSRTRLEMVVPYLEHGHWLNAMALSGLPENAEATSRLALETMDEIWCVAGDCSVDYKWYTRRAGFLPVYCATELYLLSDESNQYEETWGFLNSHVDSFFGGAAFQLNGGAGGGGGGGGGGGAGEEYNVYGPTADTSTNATMLDTMSVACKGAYSVGSAFGSMFIGAVGETRNNTSR